MQRNIKNRDPAADACHPSRETSGGACSATARFEEVPPATDASFGVFRYDRPCFERGWHYHPEAELTLIQESSGRRFVGDHIGAFEPGDLVLLGPNLPHTWRTETVPLPRDGRARSIYVHFRTGWLEETADVLPELLEIRKLLARASRGLLFAGPERERAVRELARLLEQSGLRRLVSFWELLNGLAESGGGEPLSSAGFAPMLDDLACERISKVHKHVYQCFRSGIAHQDLARLAGLSPAALSKFFRRTTGRTITEFINEVRVGEVARLLIDTTHNVSEIAYACGFESLANFNSTFRRLKQVNPTRFRELHRKP
jgi:AraC-like DNA-binding protein